MEKSMKTIFIEKENLNYNKLSIRGLYIPNKPLRLVNVSDNLMNYFRKLNCMKTDKLKT